MKEVLGCLTIPISDFTSKFQMIITISNRFISVYCGIEKSSPAVWLHVHRYLVNSNIEPNKTLILIILDDFSSNLSPLPPSLVGMVSKTEDSYQRK